MIRNAIVHLFNDQPIMVDLFALPEASDAGLLCTNLRSIDGRKPVFIERSDSRFIFPYQHIRFVEVVNEDEVAAGPGSVPVESPIAAPDPIEEDLEIDEDFLRRVREA
ncbi:MAG: hypothetical protein ABI573_06070 [Chloroflexota bacterium]